jgi:uncharacterized protein
MSEAQDALLQFPCEFPVKVMGKASGDFAGMVLEIVQRHSSGVGADALQVRPSRNGTYLAVTVTVTARDQAQLDALYSELCAHERVLMAL